MSNSTHTAIDCHGLYPADPDIDGIGTFIAFLINTVVFNFLALVVTPVIQAYLPDSIAPRVLTLCQEYWKKSLRGSARFIYDREEPANPGNNDRGNDEQESGGRGNNDGSLRYRSACRESLERAYCAQSIIGTSYLIVGFVKWRDMSPYHARLLLALVLMNMTIAHIVVFERHQSLKGFYLAFKRWVPIRRRGISPENQQVSRPVQEEFGWTEISYLLTQIGCLVLFALWLTKSNNANNKSFLTCWRGGRALADVLLTAASQVVALPWLFMRGRPRQDPSFRPFPRFIFTLVLLGVIITQAIMFMTYKRKFSPNADKREPVWNQFSFGQMLVLTMIVPLWVDYSSAMLIDYQVLKTVARISGHQPQWQSIFGVLIPMVFRSLWDAITSKFGWLHKSHKSKEEDEETGEFRYDYVDLLRPPENSASVSVASTTQTILTLNNHSPNPYPVQPRIRPVNDPDAILPAPLQD